MLDLTDPSSSGVVRSLQSASVMAPTSTGSPTWGSEVTRGHRFEGHRGHKGHGRSPN